MDAPADLIITMNDIIKAGHCPKGARRAFNEAGADFRAFMKGGMPAGEFLSMGGGLAEQVVSRKLERELIGVDMAGLTITAADAEAAGKCEPGRRTFATRAGIDLTRTGIPAEELVATGDPDALDVVRHAVKRRG